MLQVHSDTTTNAGIYFVFRSIIRDRYLAKC
jgi:hypothetical protein